MAAGGCIDNSVAAAGGADVPEDESCPDLPPTPTAPVPAAECPLASVSWELQRKWEWQGPDWGYRSAHLGRLADGNGDGLITAADAQSLVLLQPQSGVPNHPAITVLSGTGSVVAEDRELSGWGLSGSLAPRSDGLAGSQLAMIGLAEDAAQDRAFGWSDGQVRYDQPIGVEGASGAFPFVVDFHPRAGAELITSAVTSTADGTTLLDLTAGASAGWAPVAVDLDLDGVVEVIVALDDIPSVLAPDGALISTCDVGRRADLADTNVLFAIGDFDGDPEGEFAVVRSGRIGVCERDGTVTAQIDTEGANVVFPALGELDGDALPELVVGEQVGAGWAWVVAYNADLTELWRFAMPRGNVTGPLSVADLDGDGLHEVISHSIDGAVVVLGPGGVLLAQFSGPYNGSHEPPIVSDLDGDGLAELLVFGQRPTVLALTNEDGGWAVRGADDPWPGRNHFPGDRELDGDLPPVSAVPWNVSGRSVWQGLTAGAPQLPDLEIEVAELCSDDCQSSRLTVFVSNRGAADEPGPVELAVYAEATGEELGRAAIPAVPALAQRSVTIDVPRAAGGERLRLSVEGNRVGCRREPVADVVVPFPCE